MPGHPDLRLTIGRCRVLAIDWHAWLATGGPLMTLVHARGRAGFAIADVTVLHEDEVATEATVRFLTGDTPSARAAIVSWARDVGYRRLWLPDDVVELPGPIEADAHVRCNGCAARFEDGGPEFWAHVRQTGRFPTSCALCGSDLPQWRVRQKAVAEDDPSAMPATTARRTSCS